MESSMQDNDFEYVGFWPRVGAQIIDGVLSLVVFTPPLIVIYGWDYLTDENRSLGVAEVLFSWILPSVAVILFWLYKQATPGKMAVSARVVDAKTGNTLTVGQSIGRLLAQGISALPLCLGFIWVAFDSRKQSWHDKLAGTVVIRPRHRSPDPVRFET